MGPSTESSPHWSEPPTNNPHRHRRKGEGSHLHTRDIQSKAWVTTLSKTGPSWPNSHDLDMQGSKWYKGLITYYHLPLITFKHVVSYVKVININRFAAYSNMQRYSINISLLSCLDYKVVNVILINKSNIIKVELLRFNKETFNHGDPTSGHSSWHDQIDNLGPRHPSERLPCDTSTGIRGWPAHYPDVSLEVWWDSFRLGDKRSY
jgi:hypothetical protein